MSSRPLLRVLTAGLQTTVQDLGRSAAQALGVPAGGAMDEVSLRIANVLAGNPSGAAALEIAGTGFSAEFLAQGSAALGGADLGFTLDGAPVAPGVRFEVRADSVLRCAERGRGWRAYLALHAGVAVPPVLGSRSTYQPAGLGGFEGRALRSGDVIHTYDGPSAFPLARATVPRGIANSSAAPGAVARLRAVRGPQDDAFTADALATLFSSTYEVTARADRMGARLRGPPLAHRGAVELVSEGVARGSLQVPGSGQPVLLLADRQTVGGYPKIATVAAVDLPAAGQLAPGDLVRFTEVSLWEAREALLRREYLLRAWEAGGPDR